MEDIISKIIKIDQEAQEKINEIKKAKEQYKIEFDEQLKESNSKLREKAEHRIEEFSKNELNFIASQKIELENELKLKIKKLEETYEYNHDEIERKIFKSVIKPSV